MKIIKTTKTYFVAVGYPAQAELGKALIQHQARYRT